MRSQIPLKGYLSLHFGSVAILPVVIIFFLVWFLVMPAIQTRTTVQHQTMARAIAGQISAYLEGGERQLAALAESIQNRTMASDHNVVDLLDAQCGSGTFFEALFVVDNQNFVVKTVGLARSRRTNRADYIGLDFSGRSFTNGVKLLKTAFWSQTFLSTVSSRMAVALVVPLADGLIVGEITLGNLSEFISLLPLESEIVTLVIDAGGLIVADSQRQRSGQVLSVDFPAVNESVGDNASISSTFQLDGAEMLGTVVQMHAVGWKVLFAQPVKKAFQPLRDTFALIGLGLVIALGLALFIAWLLAGHLTDLFASFTDKAQSIANGRYHLHWPATRIREFFQLSQSLQRMAEKINQREKALVDSEQRLKDLVTNVPGMVYQFKADPNALESSSFTSVMQERSVEIFGLDTEEEHFFNDFMVCLPEEEQSRFVISVKDALETASPWYYEGRFTKPSGEKIWFEGRSVPRRVDGDLVYYGVLTDVTRRKAMESSLRLARFIIDKANVGIYRIDPDGRIREVNQKAAELLGYTKKELETLTMADIDPLVARQSWLSNWRKVTALGMRNLEAQHRKKDGSVIPVEVHSNLLEYEGRQYAIAFVQDISERKRIEASLRLTQFIFDKAPIGIWRMGPAGEVLDVNEQGCASLGYSREELCRMTVFDFAPGYGVDIWETNTVQLSEAETITIEAQHQRKSGDIFPIQVISKLMRFKGQAYHLAFVQDISERKRIEASLRLTQFIFDKAPIGIWRMGPAGEVLDVNEQGCASLGYSREELCRMTVFDFAPGYGVDIWETNTVQLREAETITIEAQHQRKSGDIFPIQVISKLMRFKGQAYHLAFVQDISERKRIEASLRLTQFIFDKAPIGIWRMGPAGEVLDVNEQGCASLGYSREELCRMTVFDFAPGYGVDIWETSAVQLREAETITIEAQHQRKSGDIFPIQVISKLMRFKGQEYHLAFVQDISERKRMEHALKESEQRLDLALSGANEGIWDWRVPEEGLYLDPRYYTMAGYPPNAFPNTFDEVMSRIHKDDVELVRRINEQNAAGRLEVFEVEFRFLRQDGSYMWIHSKGRVVARDENGNPTRISGTNADITERKQAEEKLRDHEQLLTNILESMNEGLVVLDSDFKYTIFNSSLSKMIGKPKAAVIGQIPWEVLPYLKDTPVEKNIKRTMAGESVETLEIQHLLPSGKTVWFRDSFSPLKDTQGRVVGVVGVITDISQLKHNEEEMRRLQNYLSNIIDSMPSILVAVDLDGNVTQWNHQTEQATGLSVDDACHQPLARVFPRLAGEAQRIRNAIRERRVISSPKVSRKLGNETRFEDITIFPLVANGVEGAVIRVDDVTGQVRLEEMMIQSEKMLSVGGLAAGMAHEINNPLAGILQNVSVLKNRLLGDLPANHKAAESAGTTLPAIQQYLTLRKLPGMIEDIRNSGSLAAAIVKNMLSFARKSEKVVSDQDLGALLDQSIDLLKTDYDMKKHYDFKRVEIARQYDTVARPVPCESSKIQQVFMNILKNGAEAMAEVADAPEVPTFILRVQDDGAWIRVEIEDNGPGMDEKTRRRIFEPFFTTKPVGKGTGLGLSVSYFIITEDHGGEMAVHTAARGGGTCFVIRLPKAGKA